MAPTVVVEETDTEAGVRLIKLFEGFKDTAYADPHKGWKVPTIGYGTTVYKNGKKVQRGDTITEAKAAEELNHWLETKARPKIRAIPHYDEMHPLMVGALESFAYNLGPAFYGGENFETITRKLKNKQWENIRETFVRYRNPGSNVEQGLLKRRNAEASLWEQGLAELNGQPNASSEEPSGRWTAERLVDLILGFRPENPAHIKSLELLAKKLPDSAFSEDADWVKAFRTPAAPPTTEERDAGFALTVDYYSQRDSETGHAHRMCFSSCCAMLLNFLKPGEITGPNADDQYFHRVVRFGDTTLAEAQLKALDSYGIKVEFRQNLGWDDLDSQLEKGIPIPIGILHHGPVTNPNTKKGHWIVVIGKTADGEAYWVHDPFGDLQLVSGGHLNTSGKKLRYSKKNLGPRWMVEGDGKGWGMMAER